MTRSYEEGEIKGENFGIRRVNWIAAIGAGLIAGGVLLVFPAGSPWARLASFSPVIMGRAVADPEGSPLLLFWTIHLGLAVLYSLVIALIVANRRNWVE